MQFKATWIKKNQSNNNKKERKKQKETPQKQNESKTESVALKTKYSS